MPQISAEFDLKKCRLCWRYWHLYTNG